MTTPLEQTKPVGDLADIMNDFYDERMYNPLFVEFFGGKDYANYGYWEGNPANAGEASENLVLKLMSMIPDSAASVLDVACGKGASTTCLSKRFDPDKIVGINISEKQLDTARKNNPGIDFRLMSAVELEFEDNSFDAVMCVEAAFHFNTRDAFLAEALRVLKPGGTLVLSDILMPLEAEISRKFRHEANYLEGVEAYAARLAEIGYVDCQVTDEIERTWRPMFMATVNYASERYLRKQIPREVLDLFLQTNYRIVEDLECYLLVSARKEG